MKTEQEYDLLLSSVSHEIRNPVTLIGSYLQLLSSAHPEVKQYEYWNTVTGEVQRLKSLLSELSAFNNGLRIHPECLDFGPWLRRYAEAADILIRSMSSSGQTAVSVREYQFPDMDSVLASSIRFSCRISQDLPILSADPGKLRQVLDNLIRNAVEAHPNDIALAARMTKGQVILEVYDDGSGIDPNDLSRLFTPFVSCKPGSTGLGLAIADRIIKAHHGTITVRSEPHVQTVFRISLPVRYRQSLQNETISGMQGS